MYYADITVTAQYSLCFIDSLFDGKPFSFYNNALMSGIAPEGAVYDVGMYIIFAIWNLPIWILGKIADINILGIFPLLWFKTLLIVFAYGTLWLLKKIVSYLKFDEYTVKYLKWVYILAPLFVFPVFVAAQYDICFHVCHFASYGGEKNNSYYNDGVCEPDSVWCLQDGI